MISYIAYIALILNVIHCHSFGISLHHQTDQLYYMNQCSREECQKILARYNWDLHVASRYVFRLVKDRERTAPDRRGERVWRKTMLSIKIVHNYLGFKVFCDITELSRSHTKTLMKFPFISNVKLSSDCIIAWWINWWYQLLFYICLETQHNRSY